MTGGSTASALRQIGTLFGSGTVAGMTDGQLLERFLERRDDGAETAFAALVARHGPMVLGVCRRALADPGDADDAFQATFLILVRKARSVRVDDSLGRWLYGVSRKVAARARVVAARRPRLEPDGFEAIEARSTDPDRFEVRSTIDEELARLPEAYRAAVVLCDLGGLSLEEAARELRCPVGTVKSRLSRGRARLRASLERRGLAPSLRMGAPMVPARLAEAVVRASAVSVVGGGSMAGLVPASAVALAEGMLKTMTGIKLKLAATALLTIGVAATGAGVMARQEKGDAKSTVPGKSGAPDAPKVQVPPAEIDRLVERDPNLQGPAPNPANPSRALEARFNQPVTLDVSNQALGSVIQSLQQETGINIILDPKALAENGLSRETPVTLHAKQLKLTVALKSLLGPIGLTYQVEDDLLLITSKPRIDREARARLRSAFLDELVRARQRLSRAEELAHDERDPAVVKARKRAADLEYANEEFERLLSALEGDDSALAMLPGRNRKPWPEGGPGDRPPGEFSKVSMPDYIIEPPDIITVEVLEALPDRPITGERLVRPDGKINLGFYGEVYVAGLTTSEVKEKVALHLRTFLDDKALGLKRDNPVTLKPEDVPPSRSDRISIGINSYNSKVYYVQGDVGSPGRLPITGNETALDAINYAGGLNPSASKASIRVVRPNPTKPGTEQYLPVDLDAIVDRGDSRTNYQILPGDRLVVYRDPKAPARGEPAAPAPAAADVEARLQTVEQKLDEILKALGRISKP